MKIYAKITIVISLLGNLAEAQILKKWGLGVSSNYGNDRYFKKFYDFDMPEESGASTKYRSKQSWRANVFGEKFVNKSLSIIGQSGYHLSSFGQTQDVDIFCDCSSASEIRLDVEKHHWAMLGAGVRWYVNPKSRVNIILDGIINAEYFLARSYKYVSEPELSHTFWNADGYRRLVPEFSGAIGVKWDRFAIMTQYDHDLLRTFTRDKGLHGRINRDLKTGFLRKGISIKASIMLIKPK